jgi:hypothetical protein
MSTSDVIVRLAYLSQKSKILKGADNWVGADNWWCHPNMPIKQSLLAAAAATADSVDASSAVEQDNIAIPLKVNQ